MAGGGLATCAAVEQHNNAPRPPLGWAKASLQNQHQKRLSNGSPFLSALYTLPFFLIRSSLFCLRFNVKEHENEANAKKLNYLDSQRGESGGRVVCEREKERERETQ